MPRSSAELKELKADVVRKEYQQHAAKYASYRTKECFIKHSYKTLADGEFKETRIGKSPSIYHLTTQALIKNLRVVHGIVVTEHKILQPGGEYTSAAKETLFPTLSQFKRMQLEDDTSTQELFRQLLLDCPEEERAFYSFEWDFPREVDKNFTQFLLKNNIYCFAHGETSTVLEMSNGVFDRLGFLLHGKDWFSAIPLTGKITPSEIEFFVKKQARPMVAVTEDEPNIFPNTVHRQSSIRLYDAIMHDRSHQLIHVTLGPLNQFLDGSINVFRQGILQAASKKRIEEIKTKESVTKKPLQSTETWNLVDRAHIFSLTHVQTIFDKTLALSTRRVALSLIVFSLLQLDQGEHNHLYDTNAEMYNRGRLAMDFLFLRLMLGDKFWHDLPTGFDQLSLYDPTELPFNEDVPYLEIFKNISFSPILSLAFLQFALAHTNQDTLTDEFRYAIKQFSKPQSEIVQSIILTLLSDYYRGNNRIYYQLCGHKVIPTLKKPDLEVITKTVIDGIDVNYRQASKESTNNTIKFTYKQEVTAWENQLEALKTHYGLLFKKLSICINSNDAKPQRPLESKAAARIETITKDDAQTYLKNELIEHYAANLPTLIKQVGWEWFFSLNWDETQLHALFSALSRSDAYYATVQLFEKDTLMQMSTYTKVTSKSNRVGLIVFSACPDNITKKEMKFLLDQLGPGLTKIRLKCILAHGEYGLALQGRERLSLPNQLLLFKYWLAHQDPLTVIKDVCCQMHYLSCAMIRHFIEKIGEEKFMAYMKKNDNLLTYLPRIAKCCKNQDDYHYFTRLFAKYNAGSLPEQSLPELLRATIIAEKATSKPLSPHVSGSMLTKRVPGPTIGDNTPGQDLHVKPYETSHASKARASIPR